MSGFEWPGPRTRRAIEAAEPLLADRAWHTWSRVIAAMVAGSDIQPVTCHKALRELVRRGDLESRGWGNSRSLRRPLPETHNCPECGHTFKEDT